MEYQNKNLEYTNAEAYDKRGEVSVLEKYVLELWQPFLGNKISELSNGKIVIDWGCGTGEYSLAAKMAKKIYCVDIAETMLTRAREKLKNFSQVEFIHSAGFNNKIEGSVGELILTVGVWEYVDQIKLLEEVKRITKSGSKVVVVFPNIYNDLNWKRSVVRMKKVALRPGYIKKLFRNDFALVESASFGMVSFVPKSIQFLVLPIWQFCDWLWSPLQKLIPLGINVYYLFERK